jgi:hypothetical protein
MVTAQQAQVLTNVAQVLLSLASVIFAGALTYVTYRYYTETRQQTVESRRNREAEFKPVLKATLVFQPVNYYHFAIVNTGKGAAHDVQAEWQVDDYSQSTWAIPHFASKDQFRFAVQLERNGEAQGNQGTLRSAQEFRNELADKDGILYYKATCEDALGNSHEFEEEIPLIETIDGRVKGTIEWQDKDEMKEIRKKLEDIEGAIEDVSKEIELGGHDSLIRGEMTEKVHDIAESRLEVSLQEMRNLTGFSLRQLDPILRRLENTDEIEIEPEQSRYLEADAEVTIRFVGEKD